MGIASLSDLAQAKHIVIKVGSALLIERGQARAEWLATLVEEIAGLACIG